MRIEFDAAVGSVYLWDGPILVDTMSLLVYHATFGLEAVRVLMRVQ